MVGAGLNVFAVWNYVIAKTRFGTIELNPKLVAAVLGGTVEEVNRAIEFLCAPDPESRSKLEGGARMVKEGQFQYRVVNWVEYQTIKSETALKEYNRRKQQEYRARRKAEEAAGIVRPKKPRAPRGKSRAQVRAENESREARFEEAVKNGDQEQADKIAAEGLPEGYREAPPGVKEQLQRQALEGPPT